MTVHDFPTSLANAIPTQSRPEQHRGQLRFAERFVHEHAGRMLHVHGIGWHEWADTHWAECVDGAETRAVKDTIVTALGDLPSLDKSARDDLVKDIQKVESGTGIAGVLNIAGDLHPCAVAGTALDGDPYLINTAGGTVDLNTCKSRKARPSDHISKVTRAGFDPDATSPVFDQFIERMQPDPDMRAFIARSLGAALIGLVREQRLMVWFGNGANGKGTLRDAVLHAMGDYAVEVPAALLLASKWGEQGTEQHRLALKGTRMAFCSEIPKGARMDEATMKKLTGGDPVTAKRLYRNPITFKPSHSLFMLTNHLPVVAGDDPAVWRRILAVPWKTDLPEAEWDRKLPEKLADASDAVFAWLWRGWLDYQKRGGLDAPAAVQEATDRYRDESDPLGRFLRDESAVIAGHGSAPSQKLFQAFQDWARAQGEPTDLTQQDFSKSLLKRGHDKIRAKGGIAWKNLMLVGEDR